MGHKCNLLKQKHMRHTLFDFASYCSWLWWIDRSGMFRAMSFCMRSTTSCSFIFCCLFRSEIIRSLRKRKNFWRHNFGGNHLWKNMWRNLLFLFLGWYGLLGAPVSLDKEATEQEQVAGVHDDASNQHLSWMMAFAISATQPFTSKQGIQRNTHYHLWNLEDGQWLSPSWSNTSFLWSETNKQIEETNKRTNTIHTHMDTTKNMKWVRTNYAHLWKEDNQEQSIYNTIWK